MLTWRKRQDRCSFSLWLKDACTYINGESDLQLLYSRIFLGSCFLVVCHTLLAAVSVIAQLRLVNFQKSRKQGKPIEQKDSKRGNYTNKKTKMGMKIAAKQYRLECSDNTQITRETVVKYLRQKFLPTGKDRLKVFSYQDYKEREPQMLTKSNLEQQRQ